MSDQISPDPFTESGPRLRMAPDARRTSTAYGPTDDVLGGREVHLLDYVKILYKRRWTGITVFLLVTSTITVYTFAVTPIFEAKTRLLIEAENQNVVTFKQVVEQDQTRADYYQTQYNIL